MTVKTRVFDIEAKELDTKKNVASVFSLLKPKLVDLQSSFNKSGLLTVVMSGEELESSERHLKSELCKKVYYY